jgi:Cu(I)/Ag(I) efflux system membrane fusion protein
MYVDYTGKSVRRGQPMVWIYSPELLTAQVELIEAEKAIRDLGASNLDLVRKSAARTAEAAREKLRLLGLTRAQVEAVLREGKPSDHITLHAPQGGVVLAKNVDEGEYVKTGQSIYTIADLSVVWVVLEAYESDLPWVETGRQVEFQTEAYPGKSFRGKVVYIDPMVNEKTRTVSVRLEVPNADGSLKPGMLVRATQQKDDKGSAAGEAPLVIPATAPLITGRRAVVYVADPSIPGRYEGREVVLGGRAGNYYIVLGGLDEGDLVVTRGNFKIDSALQIVARPSMMTPATDIPADEELPDLFVSKARLLHDTFGALAQDVASGDLERTHLAFGRFHKELRLIDGSALTGRAARLWREYAMLLGNDAILGAEAPDKRRLDEIFAEMKGHYAGFRNAFALDAPVDEADRQFDAPESFRKQLGQAFARYETLAAALVADDMAAAVQAADALAEALGQVGMDGLSGPAHNVWMEALARMNDGLAAIREAGDIVAVRAGFEPVSAGMTRAVIRLGIEAATPVYELFCPMAFDYEGATWLQRDEDIRNPYMGQAMPACGEVNRQLVR